MRINELQQKAFDTARAKGFWPDYPAVPPISIVEKLALVHSEVSEGVESLRKREKFVWYGDGGKPEGLASELADVVIRVADLAEACGIDLELVIDRKMAYNAQRPPMHGKAF